MDTLKKIAYNININLENYYNKDDSNAIFVHKSGDTMTGSLILTGASYFQLTNEVSVNEIRTDIGLSSTDNQLPTAKAVYLLTSGITSGSTDLSNYYTKNESNTNFLSGNTSYYTQAEVNYLFTVSGGTSGSTDLSNYYNKTESDANFLSANTSYYTQDGAGSDPHCSYEGYREVPKDRWTRKCKLCGFEEHTKNLKPIIKGHKPDFGD